MKNKVAPPFREVIVPLRYDRGIDWSLELARLSTSEGIVAQAGSWYTLPDGSKVQGELSLEAAIRQDKTLAVTIADQVMRNVLGRRGYGLDGVPLPGTEPFHVVPDDAIPTDEDILEAEVPV
jgi:recombination protein RecA